MKSRLKIIFTSLIAIYSLKAMDAPAEPQDSITQTLEIINLESEKHKKEFNDQTINRIIDSILNRKPKSAFFTIDKLFKEFGIVYHCKLERSDPFLLVTQQPALYILLSNIIFEKKEDRLQEVSIDNIIKLNEYFKQVTIRAHEAIDKNIEKLIESQAKNHSKIHASKKSQGKIITKMIDIIISQKKQFTLYYLLQEFSVVCNTKLFEIATEGPALYLLITNILYAKQSEYSKKFLTDLSVESIGQLNNYFKQITQEYQEILDNDIEQLKN